MNAANTDDELIVGLVELSSRRAAAAEIYQRYAARFMAYLMRRGYARPAAEDAVQEAFIRLIRGAPSFVPSGQGRAWIWQVAKSAWLDLLKHKEVETENWDDSPELAQGVTPDVADTSNFQDCVHGQLARFSLAYPEAGQAIIWAAVDGLKSTQIGELLGRSAGATREFLSQTRKRLQDYLAPCM